MAGEADLPNQEVKRALASDMEEVGNDRKISRGRRQWAGKLPTTSTPVRAGTTTKTPIRERADSKASKMQVLSDEIDERMEGMNEQMQELRKHIEDMQEKLETTQDDQWAYRVQQLWSLKVQIREQRDKAAKEQCFVGWPETANGEQRTEFIHWCLSQAGLDTSTCEISHSIKAQQLSPLTVITFKHAWMRIQLDRWFKEEYINKKKPLYYYANGAATNDSIKMRPQIALWDRIKGEPLKICLKAMDMAHREGRLQIDMNKVRPWWGQNAIYDDYHTFVWVHFSVKNVLATVYLDQAVYNVVTEYWSEAMKFVKGVNRGETSTSSTKTGPVMKGKGKGKGKPFDTIQGEYPFEIKLAEVKDWHYDERIRAHEQDKSEGDL